MLTTLRKTALLLLLAGTHLFTHAQAPSITWQRNFGGSQDDYSANVATVTGGDLIVTSIEAQADPTGVYYPYMVVRRTDHFGGTIWQRTFDPMAINNLPNTSFGQPGFTPQWVRVGVAQDMVIDIYISPQGGGATFHDLLHLDSTGAFLSHHTFTADLLHQPDDSITYSVRAIGDPTGVDYNVDSLVLTRLHSYMDVDTVMTVTGFKQHFLRSGDPDIFYTYTPGDIARYADGSIVLVGLLRTWTQVHCSDCGGPVILSQDVVLHGFSSDGTLTLERDLISGSQTVTDPHLIRSEINGSWWVYWSDWPQGHSHGNTHIIELDHTGHQITDHPLVWNYTKLIQNFTANGFYAVGTADDSTVFTGAHGQSDAVVAAYDQDGAEQWRKAFGGSDFEFARDIVATADGGLIFYSDAQSQNGDVTSPQGGRDAWLVKLGGEVNGIHEQQESTIAIYPNPSHGTIHITAQQPITQARITDMAGQTITDQTVSGTTATIRTTAIAAGSYILTVTATDHTQLVYHITIM